MQAFSSQWPLGTGASIRWPAGNAIAAEGNSGVAAAIDNRRGAIGYISSFNPTSSLKIAALQNKAGEFQRPNLISAAKALKAIELDFNLAGSSPNPSVEGAYPIVTLIWVLAYRSGNGENTPAIRAALDFMLSSQAQSQVAELGLIPLETEIVSKSRPVVERIAQ